MTRDVFAEWPDTHYLTPTEIEEMEMSNDILCGDCFLPIRQCNCVFPLPRDYARFVRIPNSDDFVFPLDSNYANRYPRFSLAA